MIYLPKKGSDSVKINYKIIGQRIMNTRKKQGISKEMLSEKINATAMYISKIEKGSRVNLERIVKIAEVLGVTVEYLLTGSIPEYKNYLDKELYEILISCTPAQQRLIYNIAKIVVSSKLV